MTRCQGSMKLSPVDHLVDGILFLVQKGSNAKKESFCCTEPIVYQVYHSKQKSNKKKIKVFYRRFPKKRRLVLSGGRLRCDEKSKMLKY